MICALECFHSNLGRVLWRSSALLLLRQWLRSEQCVRVKLGSKARLLSEACCGPAAAVLPGHQTDLPALVRSRLFRASRAHASLLHCFHRSQCVRATESCELLVEPSVQLLNPFVAHRP